MTTTDSSVNPSSGSDIGSSHAQENKQENKQEDTQKNTQENSDQDSGGMPEMPELTEIPSPQVVTPSSIQSEAAPVHPQHPLMGEKPSVAQPADIAQSHVGKQVQTDNTQKKQEQSQTSSQSTAVQSPETSPETSTKALQRNSARKPRIRRVQKKGSKLSLKKFLLGCSLFLILVIGLIGGGLYYIVQNPEQIGGIVDIDTVKQGLRIFAILFFAFLFFLGLGFLVVNAYRLSTVKEGSKIKYVAGVMSGIFIVAIAIGTGVVVLQNITQISGAAVRTDNTVLIQVPTSPTPRYLHNSPNIQLIAPISLSFQLNRTIFERTVLNVLNGNEIQQVVLSCGNGQELNANATTLAFQGSCLYREKGNKPLTLTIVHRNRTTGVQEEYEVIVDTLAIASEIALETSAGSYQLNEAQTEISIGQAPAKISIDANQVFQDFQLANYEIDRDMDEDGDRDVQDDVAFEFNLVAPGLTTLRYTIPALGEYVYEIPVRVAQSDVPICQLQTQQLQESNYQFSVLCDDPSIPISEYSLVIREYPSDEIVYETKSSRPLFTYAFEQGGQYIFQLNYITREGKEGRYESIVTDIGGVMHDVAYILSYQEPNMDAFQEIQDNPEQQVFLNDQEIVVTKLPVDIELLLNSITPLSTQTNTQVLYGDNPVLATQDNQYIVRVDSPEEQLLEIVVREGEQEGTRIVIPIRVQQSVVRGKIRALGGTVGFDPFQVRLDASTISLADEDDEIIYFSWDFGDGTVKPNTSQGSMTHTYNYDVEEENGRYAPRVTIMTKKGIEETILLENPILVKKRAVDVVVRSPSHVSQIAGVDEQVSLSLATDGDPRQVLWDFGDGQTFECDSRSCFDTSVTYTTPGTYAISVSITYSNGEVAQSAPLTMIVE